MSDESAPLRTMDIGAMRAGGGAPVPLEVVVVGGPEEGRDVALEKTLTVGTDPACELTLTDRAVSRKHLETG